MIAINFVDTTTNKVNIMFKASLSFTFTKSTSSSTFMLDSTWNMSEMERAASDTYFDDHRVWLWSWWSSMMIICMIFRMMLIIEDLHLLDHLHLLHRLHRRHCQLFKRRRSRFLLDYIVKNINIVLLFNCSTPKTLISFFLIWAWWRI